MDFFIIFFFLIIPIVFRMPVCVCFFFLILIFIRLIITSDKIFYYWSLLILNFCFFYSTLLIVIKVSNETKNVGKKSSYFGESTKNYPDFENEDSYIFDERFVFFFKKSRWFAFNVRPLGLIRKSVLFGGYIERLIR